MDPLLDEHYERVHKAQEILREGSDRCLNQLKLLVKPLFNSQNLDSKVVFRQMFLEMGGALFRATKPFLREEWEQRSLNFYFWPGYDSILHDDPKSKRITLVWEDSPDREILCGAGYQLTKDGIAEYREANTSLWFQRALTVCEEKRGRFIPGGTHAWIAQENLKIRDTEKTEEGWDSLTALLVQVREDHISHYSAHRGVARLQLSDQDYRSWGKLGSRWLNDKSKIICDKNWPTPIETKVDRTKSDKEKRRLQIVRQKLYNIWLAATFDIEWRTDWFYTFLRQLRYRDLNSLADRLQRDPLDQALLKNPPFRWWYTLGLASSVEKLTGTQPLGSAMILASAEIPTAYIYLATAFVNETYFRIRDVESALKFEEVGKFWGQERQASIFAHQTVGLITEPWVDPARRDLKEESQFSLWMAKTLVTEIWGSVKLEAEGSICSGAGADFPEWESLSPRGLLERILSPALFQGLRRAAKAPPPSDDVELDELNWRSKKIATKLLYKRSDRDALLRERLGLVLPEDSPPGWTTFKGFMLSFYHSVWQATHHALKASLEEGKEPYLWIEWDLRKVVIYNRAASITMGIGPAKDRRFLDILEQKLDGSFTIEGPEPTDKDETVWRTTINYHGADNNHG
jgi:hypothetical protein